MTAKGGCPTFGELHGSKKIDATETRLVQIILGEGPGKLSVVWLSIVSLLCSLDCIQIGRARGRFWIFDFRFWVEDGRQLAIEEVVGMPR